MSVNDPQRVTIRNVRLAFPAIYEPKGYQGNDDLKYQATFIIKKDDPQIAAIRKAMVAAVAEGFRITEQEAIAKLRSITAHGNILLKDGDARDDDNFAGAYFLNARNNAKPTIYSAQLRPIGQGEKGAPYGGCYVNASIRFYTTRTYGNKLCVSLLGIQFAGDGAAFSKATVATEEDFGGVSVAQEADFLGAPI